MKERVESTNPANRDERRAGWRPEPFGEGIVWFNKGIVTGSPSPLQEKAARAVRVLDHLRAAPGYTIDSDLPRSGTTPRQTSENQRSKVTGHHNDRSHSK